jgi:putative phosphoesterase
MALFEQLDVGHVVHCGDVGSPGVFDEMLGRPCTFVWGNMDFPNDELLTYARALGLPIPDEIPTKLELDGKRFAVFHGHEPGFSDALRHLDVDYILHGHTHAACDETLDGKRIINPGALYRAARKTVATLDTKTDLLSFHEIRGV